MTRHFGTRVLCLFLGCAAVIAPAINADVTYRLGPAIELLDADFYAGQPEDESNVAGRWAFDGVVSNDGRTVAFRAVNVARAMASHYESMSLFLVDLGYPSSWRRISPDFHQRYYNQITWTPDGGHVVTAPHIADMSGSEWSVPTFFGTELCPKCDACFTRLPEDNWLIMYDDSADGNIAAIPVLLDGTADPSRERVIVTDFSGTVSVDWPTVSVDGTAVAFVDSFGDHVPDEADVYVLKDLDAILAAEKRPGTDYSILAPTSLSDPRIAAIRTSETAHFAHGPYFSEDKTLVFYHEDWNYIFQDEALFLPTLLQADFDIMISNADGSGDDVRLAEPENQAFAIPTPGGTRLLYINHVNDAFRLFASTLEVATDVEGTPVGEPEDNDVITAEDQTCSDASGTVVDIPAGTAIDFPPGEPQEIQITTPIDPVTEPQLPSFITAIPVVRKFGPEGTTFDPPITVTISYTNAEAEGLDEGHLRIFRYNELTGMYDIEVTTIVDRNLDNNTISFTVSSFSIYGVGGLDPSSLPLNRYAAAALAVTLAASGLALRRRRKTATTS